jgi:hypothetical protein
MRFQGCSGPEPLTLPKRPGSIRSSTLRHRPRRIRVCSAGAGRGKRVGLLGETAGCEQTAQKPRGRVFWVAAGGKCPAGRRRISANRRGFTVIERRKSDAALGPFRLLRRGYPLT